MDTQEAMPNIQARLVQYTTSRGTEVTQQRFYAVNEENKWRQLKNTHVRAAMLSGDLRVALDPSFNPQEVLEVQAPSTADAVGAVAVDAATEVPNPAVKPHSRVKRLFERMRGWGNRAETNVARGPWATVGAAAMGVMALVGLGRANYINGGDSKVMRPAPSSTGSSLIFAQSSVLKGDVPSTTTTTEATTETPENQDHKDLLAAFNAETFNRIGMGDHFAEVTDPKAVFPGALEANVHSMDHGPAAWNNLPRTTEGAKQLSEAILNAAKGFTQSDTEVVKEAMRTVAGMPDELIDQLAAGDYSNVEYKVYIAKKDVKRLVYKDMSFNNNGKMAIDSERLIANADQDAIALMSFKDANGKVQVASFRIDCGGIDNQAFRSLIVEVPQKTTEKHRKHRTTNTTMTTNTTTSSTVPSTTTTTVGFHAKPAPAPVPGEIDPNVPADPVTGPTTTTSIAPTTTTMSTLPGVTTTSTTAAQGGHQPSN